MKIVVDSNIVFSAILNTRSNIGQIITIGAKHYDFYTTYLLKVEILNHKHKIQKITGFNDERFTEIFELITSKIRFVDEILLSNKDLESALLLTRDIDEDDTLFVALTNHIDGKLWTGDKRLEKGLKKKNYTRLITTNELFNDFIKKEIISKRFI
ncbi:MAG: hypothetical protein DRJ10_06245 [Bacteroidetes bacterium]|nr:MAG: hypothetical protein DRJ10_06245 [Bacteroidota bacterium]